jgi:predicted flap endonuclease-1-like 5' DNA nuclease
MLKIFSLILLAAVAALLWFQHDSGAIPTWFAVVGTIVALVGGWAVARTNRDSLASWQAPIAVGLIIVGLCALLVALTSLNSGWILTAISAVIGLIGAWWLWASRWSSSASSVVTPGAAAAAAAAATASAAASVVSEPVPASAPVAAMTPVEEVRAEPKAAPRKAAPKKAESKKAVAKAAPAKAAPAKAAAPVKAAASGKKEKFVTDAPKPKNLITKKPAKADIDDLKKVNGIGPVFEKMLHKNGIYTFKQLGAFTKKDVEWLSGQIDSFPDRIERKEWVKQAKTLAKVKK